MNNQISSYDIAQANLNERLLAIESKLAAKKPRKRSQPTVAFNLSYEQYDKLAEMVITLGYNTRSDLMRAIVVRAIVELTEPQSAKDDDDFEF